jgi:Spy/CpxP family protein refolding chaperone
MTEQTSPAPDTTAQPDTPRRRRRGLAIAAIVIAAGLTGAAVTAAVSQPYGFGPGGWHGHGFGMMRGMHGGPMGRFGFDPARAEERLDRMVRHLAVEIDASNEQQDKLRNVAKAALKEVLPAREKLHAARQQAHTLLSAPTIDRGAIEKLRAEQIALADQVSKRVVQAIADAAEILTPEQRKKLEEHVQYRRFGHGFGPGWRRG